MSDVETHRCLLAAIAAAPDDVAPRQVYADWLEERGDPRAAFFRQAPQTANLRTGWDEGAGPLLRDFRFEHYSEAVCGVLLAVLLPAEIFIERGGALLDTFPLIHQLSLKLGDRGQPAALAATPALARLPSVGFAAKDETSRLGDLGLEAFLASPHLDQLDALGFERSDVGAPGLAALVRRELPALRHLGIYNNPIGAKGIAALTQSRTMRLSSLNFISAQLDDEAVTLLAAWPGFASLRQLGFLYEHDLGDAALEALAGSPYVAGLEDLEISGARFGERGARAVLDSPQLAGLKTFSPGMNRDYNQVRDAGVKVAMTERFGTAWAW